MQANLAYTTGGGQVAKTDAGPNFPTSGLTREAYYALMQQIAAKAIPAKAPAGDGGLIGKSAFGAAPTVGRPGAGTMAPPPPPDKLAGLREEAEAQQLQAMISPPPTSLSYAGGSAGFYTMDPLKMSAIQRKAYLPNGSEAAPVYQDPNTPYEEQQSRAFQRENEMRRDYGPDGRSAWQGSGYGAPPAKEKK